VAQNDSKQSGGLAAQSLILDFGHVGVGQLGRRPDAVVPEQPFHRFGQLGRAQKVAVPVCALSCCPVNFIAIDFPPLLNSPPRPPFGEAGSRPSISLFSSITHRFAIGRSVSAASFQLQLSKTLARMALGEHLI
jgi:hypothetical protein